jgi:hypothetical protein
MFTKISELLTNLHSYPPQTTETFESMNQSSVQASPEIIYCNGQAYKLQNPANKEPSKYRYVAIDNPQVADTMNHISNLTGDCNSGTDFISFNAKIN